MKTTYKKVDFESEDKRRKLVEDLNKLIKDSDKGVHFVMESNWIDEDEYPQFYAKCFVLKQRTTITEVEGGFIEQSVKFGPIEYFVSAYDGTEYKDVLILNDIESVTIENKKVEFVASINVEEVGDVNERGYMRIKQRKETRKFLLRFEN